MRYPVLIAAVIFIGCESQPENRTSESLWEKSSSVEYCSSTLIIVPLKFNDNYSETLKTKGLDRRITITAKMTLERGLIIKSAEATCFLQDKNGKNLDSLRNFVVSCHGDERLLPGEIKYHDFVFSGNYPRMLSCKLVVNSIEYLK